VVQPRHPQPASPPHRHLQRLATVVRGLRSGSKPWWRKFAFSARVRANSRPVMATELRGTQSELPAVVGGAPGCMARLASPIRLCMAVGSLAPATLSPCCTRQVWPSKPRAFSIGLRIEHPQRLASTRARWGALRRPSTSGPLRVTSLSNTLPQWDEPSYSFCHVPGGLVVAAASEAGHVVTTA